MMGSKHIALAPETDLYINYIIGGNVKALIALIVFAMSIVIPAHLCSIAISKKFLRNAKKKEAIFSTLYSWGLVIERISNAPHGSRIAKFIDELTRQGISRDGVKPCSKLVGGDGDYRRYSKEMNTFGFYTEGPFTYIGLPYFSR